jgi:hypothetical protein
LPDDFVKFYMEPDTNAPILQAHLEWKGPSISVGLSVEQLIALLDWVDEALSHWDRIERMVRVSQQELQRLQAVEHALNANEARLTTDEPVIYCG